MMIRLKELEIDRELERAMEKEVGGMAERERVRERERQRERVPGERCRRNGRYKDKYIEEECEIERQLQGGGSGDRATATTRRNGR